METLITEIEKAVIRTASKKKIIPLGYRVPELHEFVKGFKYKAWIGYEWMECVFPHGFSLSQMQDCINNQIVITKN